MKRIPRHRESRAGARDKLRAALQLRAMKKDGLPRWLCLLAMTGLMVLSACMPQEQAYRAAEQAPAMEQGFYNTSDGARLPMRQWGAKRARAVVIALHGFNDYSSAFAGMGAYFKTRGIATYAYDQRGFGASEDRGIWAGEENLTRDVREFVSLVATRHPRTPIYVLGESMGGAVVLVADAKEKLPVSGLILSAPAVWGSNYMPPVYGAFLWTAAHTFPHYELTGRGLKIMASNNIPMLREMGRDPLVIKSTRIDAIYGLTHLMDHAYDSAPHVQSRVLMLYGFKDQVIPRPPIESVEKRLNASSRTIFYDDGYHMLTRDLQGKEVMKDIADWMLKRKN